jgi:hypothetical protein
MRRTVDTGACQTQFQRREGEKAWTWDVDARGGSPGRVESGRGKKTRRAISCLNHDKLITMLGEIDCGLGFGVARATLQPGAEKAYGRCCPQRRDAVGFSAVDGCRSWVECDATSVPERR